MPKHRPGIFDPWRQEAPPEAKPGAVLHEDLDVLESEGATGTTPVRFAGKRGGIVVWVPPGDAEKTGAQAQANLLTALQTLLADTALAPIFCSWSVSLSNPGGATITRISNGPRTVFVVGDYENALDSIVFSLREAARLRESVEKYLTSLGIRPYIR